MNELDNIYEKSNSSSEFAKFYFKHLVEIIDRINLDDVGAVMEEILRCRNSGKNIFFIGNGGSAATASHFANDISIGTRTSGLKPFKAISLTDNMAIISALANDEGYEAIFTKQLEVHMNKGDIVIAISASGNSPNIIHALDFVKSFGNKTIGFTGFEGGKLKEICDLNIHIPTDRGEYGPVEDFHMILDHLFGSYFNRIVLDERKEK